MAIAKLSPLVGAVAGEVGGVNFVGSSRGLVLRGLPTTCARQSVTQARARSRFAAARRAWSQLTDAQRAAWRTAASGISVLNRVGVRRYLSGPELYLRVCLGETSYDGVFPTAVPAGLVGQQARITQVYSSGTPVVTVVYTIIGVSKPWTVKVWGCNGGVAWGRSHPLRWRYIGEYTWGAGYPTLTSDWIAAWGAAPRQGESAAMMVTNRTGCFWSEPSIVRFRAGYGWNYF